MQRVVRKGLLGLHGNLRSPFPHYRLQSSRPRINTVTLLQGGCIASSLRIASTAFHLAPFALARTFRRAGPLLASTALVASAFLEDAFFGGARKSAGFFSDELAHHAGFVPVASQVEQE